MKNKKVYQRKTNPPCTPGYKKNHRHRHQIKNMLGLGLAHLVGDSGEDDGNMWIPAAATAAAEVPVPNPLGDDGAPAREVGDVALPWLTRPGECTPPPVLGWGHGRNIEGTTKSIGGTVQVCLFEVIEHVQTGGEATPTTTACC